MYKPDRGRLKGRDISGNSDREWRSIWLMTVSAKNWSANRIDFKAARLFNRAVFVV
jgi:hypothetical protein